MTTKEDLEEKWNIKKSIYPSIKYYINDIPAELLNLTPYIDIFCVNGQTERDEFLEMLPQICFEELQMELDNIEGEFLINWLADVTNSNKSGNLWSA